jgi:hypothetical protein
MKPWPRNPLLYEINTWVWLGQLSREAGRPLTLATVPGTVWDAVAGLGFDAVWLMGVWERSPAGIGIARGNPGLLADFRRALPDFTDQDNVGSPYCVRRYTVDARLGGPKALAKARGRLAERGLRLILDFVPNHVAPDHPWVKDHPEYFIQGHAADLAASPESFVSLGGKVYACGRDPYFPAWSDVLQLNAFAPGLRAAVIKTLKDIAGQCDGLRCDMAMLLLDDVFQRTWGERAGPQRPTAYWPEVIPAVREAHPGFRFMAEAYWDLEWELQQQGFDFCYDKRLYDRLSQGAAREVRLHLQADIAYQEKLVRFIENHDEPRAAEVFGPKRQRAMAMAALTLPGAGLVHEGQLEGRRVRVPVFLGRRPQEVANEDLSDFYRRLLAALRDKGIKDGTWRLCACEGWPDNASHQNLVAWAWRTAGSRCLVVVNLSATPAQGRVLGIWDDTPGGSWRLRDEFTSQVYERDGDEMRLHGLYVDLPAWGFHFLVW